MSVPEGLTDRRLVFDHALCHALFNRKKDRSASLPTWSLEDLIDYHWLLKAELKKRGLIHSGCDELDAVAVGKSTLEAVKLTVQQIGAKSLYLKNPHSMMLWTGEKKIIVKSRSYGGMLHKPLYWGDKDNIYGVLKFTDIQPISIEEFELRQHLHGITSEERKEWWNNGQQLYVYTFEVIEKFRKPKPHIYSRGTQVYFGSPQWKSSGHDFVVAVKLDGAIAETDEDAPIPEAFIEATPKTLVKECLEDIAKIADVLIYTERSQRYYEISANWLHKHGLPYSQFILGKPSILAADLNIEDLISFGDSWQSTAKSIYSTRAVYAGLVKTRHRRDECMLCKEPPTIEVMWAEGMAHAWFCAKHFESWKRDEGTENDICDTAKVKYGIASQGWSKGGKRGRYELKKFEVTLAETPDVSFSSWKKSDVDNLSKQHGIDLPTGEPSFYPGRTWEGVRTSGVSGAEEVGQIDDVDGYDPKKVDEETLQENHQVTHDWWNAIQSGEQIEYDGATVKALHDAIAREIRRRGSTHDTPLIAADLEKMVRQRGNQWCVLHHTGEPIKCWSGPGAHDKALAMHRAILARRHNK